MADVTAPPPPPAASGGDWLAEEDESVLKERQARGKLASEVAVCIERTMKAFRQFGVRHKTSKNFIHETVRRVEVFTQEHGELALSVVGSDLLYEGESIYSEQDLRASYPFLLFRDGVQRLILEHGIEPEEVATFCKILRDQSLQGANMALEDDLVTLLWDADLQHVRYVINESFRQEQQGTDEDEDAQNRARLVAQIREDAYASTLDDELSTRFVRPPKDAEVDRAQQDLEVAAAWEQGNAIAENEDARKSLAAQVDPDDTLLRKFLEIVFVEILGQKDPAVRVALIKLVRDFAVESTRRDQLAEAIGVLRALGDLARMAGAEGRKVAQEILGSIATPEILAEIMNQLEWADEAGTEQLLHFLALIPPREARGMIAFLSTVTTAARRRAVCQLLADRLGDDLAAIGEQVRDAEEPLAIDLVYLLRNSKAPRARVELLVALDHYAPSVRRAAFAAIRFGAAATDPVLVGAALLCLEDVDADLRRLGLYSLPRVIDADIAKRLKVIIGRDAFDHWDYSDKRRAFLAYAMATGKRAAKEFVDCLGTRTMFSSDDLDDRRCSAAFGLAALGDDAHMPVLEAEVKRLIGASKRVKEACEAAMAILKFKRPIEADQPAPMAALDDVQALPTAHLPGPIWEEIGNASTMVGAPAIQPRERQAHAQDVVSHAASTMIAPSRRI